ncbi:unnamed protein product [Arabis nemorensis]|uniref:Uncharacterized protein n=1 Tax=Arabis nemorensis TaxID=586526 RepID=A0A565CPU9_9BRAS|nr:unnamed protein product [Arabis nemorensis]
MSLCNSASNGVISMNLVKNSVLNEEVRRKSSPSFSRSDVMVSESRGRSSYREPMNNKNRSKSKSNKFANLECHYCHKKGHMKKDYWKLKKDNKLGKKQEDGEDRMTVAEDQFLILLESDAINVACQDTIWVVDSGATTHATSQRDLFATYTPGSYGSVKMGNDAVAKGNLMMRVSIVYLEEAKVSKDIVNVVENDDAIELWHKRLGHMSEKGLSVLSKKKAITGK